MQTTISPSASLSGFSLPIVLTIAGSDSGGGAGIQADIKAISATGSYACSVITALTAQNTLGVSSVMTVNADFVEAQLESVFTDLDVQAVKIGMLSDHSVIHVVAKLLKKYKPKYIVLDPVMVATSGDVLLESNAISSLIAELFPLADVVTPNLYEALILLGKKASTMPANEGQLFSLAEEILSFGCGHVLLKGGHLEGERSVDVLYGKQSKKTAFSVPRVDTKNTHGTGCTLSSALASYLAQGFALNEAVRLAKYYVSKAIKVSESLNVGAGAGPVHHFYDLKPDQYFSIPHDFQETVFQAVTFQKIATEGNS